VEFNFNFLLYFAALIAGLACLVWSADRFVAGAASIAENFGISPLIIGLTIVSIGTSAPEILVSASAALNGSTAMAAGNALGSNLANICLVLATTAIICPLAVSARMAHREMPIMVAVTLLAGYALWDNYLARLESILLVLALISFLVYLVLSSRNAENTDGEDFEHLPINKAYMLLPRA